MPTINLKAVLLFFPVFAAPALLANDLAQEQPDAHIDPAEIENLLNPDHSLLDIIDTDMATGCCKVWRKGKAWAIPALAGNTAAPGARAALATANPYLPA